MVNVNLIDGKTVFEVCNEKQLSDLMTNALHLVNIGDKKIDIDNLRSIMRVYELHKDIGAAYGFSIRPYKKEWSGEISFKRGTTEFYESKGYKVVDFDLLFVDFSEEFEASDMDVIEFL